ncbi:YjzD family protein [Ectobacillus sp. sgz5001026]|uniref:YjzD family protein n=1 Tax=Ectobacillus sp. sgz5001026 TaxID=3242473 RepID=UPI0036D26B10
MKYISSFFWSFVLVQMASYVISSMTSTKYDFTQSTLMSVVITVLILLIASLVPNEPSKQH